MSLFHMQVLGLAEVYGPASILYVALFARGGGLISLCLW
jgi:hypothetical protein